MHKIIYLMLLVALTYSNNMFAQSKYEKESRIKTKDVPAKALLFIDSINIKNKVKWYMEEGLTRKSIEAKFFHNTKRYSIEFDTLGNIEDIEIEIKWKDLDSNLRDSICFKLKTDCIKHKIVKVQKQFTGSESELYSVLNAEFYNPSITIKYELIVRCSVQKNTDLYEYLFSEKGKKLSISKIVFKNSSHLEY